MSALHESTLTSLKFLHRGKVRDLYEVDADHLLIVQTDRLSAFDVILPTPIPGKGEVLTAVSNFWFRKLAHVIPNHLSGIDPESVVKTEADRGHRARLSGRLRLEGLQEDRCGVRHPAAGRHAGSAETAATAVHALDQGGGGRPRRE